MAINIGRRKFIIALGSAASLAWPLVARPQQPPIPVIGWLSSISPGVSEPNLAAFRKALAEAGYVEHQNVGIEYRWAEGRYDRLPAMAADLVAQRVTLIATVGGEASALAAKAATSTIPIVMVAGGDPVQEGLVASLNRPGGNITGVIVFAPQMESKRLGLLHEAVPTAKIIGVLLNPSNAAIKTIQLHDVQEAAPRLGVELVILDASSEGEFEGVFARMAKRKVDALLVGADPFFNSRRARLIGLAAQHRLPAIYEWRDFALEGGLMSYGTVRADAYRQIGIYAGRILKGEMPGDLPVVQPTNFQFVINLKTAKALGFEFSPTLSARADEVIE